MKAVEGLSRMKIVGVYYHRRGHEEREEGKQRRAERRIFQTEDMTTLVLSSTVLTHLNENAPSTHPLADTVPWSQPSISTTRFVDTLDGAFSFK